MGFTLPPFPSHTSAALWAQELEGTAAGQGTGDRTHIYRPVTLGGAPLTPATAKRWHPGGAQPQGQGTRTDGLFPWHMILLRCRHLVAFLLPSTDVPGHIPLFLNRTICEQGQCFASSSPGDRKGAVTDALLALGQKIPD